MQKGNVIDLATYREKNELNHSVICPAPQELGEAIQVLIQRLRDFEPLSRNNTRLEAARACP